MKQKHTRFIWAETGVLYLSAAVLYDRRLKKKKKKKTYLNSSAAAEDVEPHSDRKET